MIFAIITLLLLLDIILVNLNHICYNVGAQFNIIMTLEKDQLLTISLVFLLGFFFEPIVSIVYQTGKSYTYSVNLLVIWREIRDSCLIGSILRCTVSLIILIFVLTSITKKENLRMSSKEKNPAAGSSSSKANHHESVQLESEMNARVSKFIAKPAQFSGMSGQNPHAWLKSLNRLYRGVGFKDDEIILIAASYFTGPALVWWNVVEYEITSWNVLVDKFAKQFADEGQVDLWWEELETMRQKEHQYVDDVKFRCLELFEVLGVNSDANRKRYFLRAIKPYIAQKITDQDQHHDWNAVTAAAKRIELSNSKYNANGDDHGSMKSLRFSVPGNDVQSNHPSAQPNFATRDTAPSTGRTAAVDDNASVASLSTVMKELCKDLSALQLFINTSLNEGSGRGGSYSGPNRGNGTETRTCYNCQQPGHLAYNCPSRDNRNGPTNEAADNQGKDSGHQ